MKAIVSRSFYDWDGRKYMELDIEGKMIRVKVPYRYGRVGAKTSGIKSIQEFIPGDEIEVGLKTVNWDGVEFLVLESYK
jgi:hypothetical protein